MSGGRVDTEGLPADRFESIENGSPSAAEIERAAQSKWDDALDEKVGYSRVARGAHSLARRISLGILPGNPVSPFTALCVKGSDLLMRRRRVGEDQSARLATGNEPDEFAALDRLLAGEDIESAQRAVPAGRARPSFGCEAIRHVLYC